MFIETANTPTEICAVVEATTRKRRTIANVKSAPCLSDAPIASSGATSTANPNVKAPRAGSPTTDDGQTPSDSQYNIVVVGSPMTSRAGMQPEPNGVAPDWSSGHIPLSPYDPAPNTETVAEIVQLHRLRQDMIRAQTKLSLQGQAALRFMFQRDEDFASDEAKEKARKRNKSLYRQVVADPAHELYGFVAPYMLAAELLEAQRAVYEKALVKAAKRLPVYEWVKGVKGFGDISFATIVGECGDIGTYKSVSAVWKRLGLAVINGKRQGAPGEGATKEDWIEHGYNKQRRSVSYIAREHVIGGMGKWRPEFGSDLADASYYQRVYAERARYEAEKLGLPVTESDKGKESYKKHVAMRAHRYVEKRLIKHLYLEWRRA